MSPLLLQACTIAVGIAGAVLAMRSMECFRLYPQDPSPALLRLGFLWMGGAGASLALAVPMLVALNASA